MSSKAEVRHFRSASARQRHDCEAIRYHGTHFDAGFHADDGYLLGIVVQRGLRLEFTITSGAIVGLPQNAKTALDNKKSAQKVTQENRELGIEARRLATEQTRMIQAYERKIIKRQDH